MKVSPFTCFATDAEFSVVTWNICRGFNILGTPFDWGRRAAAVVEEIRRMDADILCLQECRDGLHDKNAWPAAPQRLRVARVAEAVQARGACQVGAAAALPVGLVRHFYVNHNRTSTVATVNAECPVFALLGLPGWSCVTKAAWETTVAMAYGTRPCTLRLSTVQWVTYEHEPIGTGIAEIDGFLNTDGVYPGGLNNRCRYALIVGEALEKTLFGATSYVLLINTRANVKGWVEEKESVSKVDFVGSGLLARRSANGNIMLTITEPDLLTKPITCVTPTIEFVLAKDYVFGAEPELLRLDMARTNSNTPVLTRVSPVTASWSLDQPAFAMLHVTTPGIYTIGGRFGFRAESDGDVRVSLAFMRLKEPNGLTSLSTASDVSDELLEWNPVDFSIPIDSYDMEWVREIIIRKVPATFVLTGSIEVHSTVSQTIGDTIIFMRALRPVCTPA